MKSILLSGYYGYGNLGDELVLSAIIKGLRSFLPEDLRITVLSGDPERTRQLHGVEAIRAKSIPEALAAICRSDLVISGGGTLLQDITGYGSMIYYLSILKAAMLLRKPTMIFAQGMGPVDSEFLRRLAKPVLEKVDAITLRDRHSLDFLREIGVKRDDIRVTADPVFSFHNDCLAQTRQTTGTVLPAQTTGTVLSVSLRESPGFGGRELAELVDIVDNLAASHNMPVRVAVMHPALDMQISTRFLCMLNTGAKELVDTSYLALGEEALSLYRGSALVISMRLHGLILSAMAHVPFIGLSDDPKLAAFASKFPGLPCFRPKGLKKEPFIESAIELIKGRVPLSKEISKTAESEYIRQKENYSIAIGLIGGGK